MKTLKQLFLDELADMYDAERRIVKALPRMAKAATHNELKRAINSHLKETQGQIKKLDRVFAICGMKPKGKTCEATIGLLEEADEIAADFKGSPAINAALIAAAQKVEHYEIASYGCLHEWAGILGHKEASILLQEILEEEKAANEALTLLARARCNEAALSEAASGEKKLAGKKAGRPRRGIRPVAASNNHLLSKR